MATNKSFFKFHIFGWFVYASRKKMFLLVPKPCRGQGYRNRMRQIRKSRYRNTGGCCEHCGQHFDIKQLEMHHIMPISDFPKLGRKSWNVLMLCPRCHYLMHKNPVIQAAVMQRTAADHSVNIAQAYQRIVTRQWQKAAEIRSDIGQLNQG